MVELPRPKNSLGAALLREEISNKSEYEEYRMNLELALNRAERFDRITFHVFWVSFLLATILMFVGGSQVIGSFDPYDDTANPLSMVISVIYVLANVTWPLSLAFSFSRFRPRIRNVKQEINDAKIDQLQREVEKLRESLGE